MIAASGASPSSHSEHRYPLEAKHVLLIARDLSVFTAFDADRTPSHLVTFEFRTGDLSTLSASLDAYSPLPDYIGIELIGSASEILAELHDTMRVIPDRIRVVGLGTINDIAFYRAALKAGLYDYITLPLQKRDLEILLSSDVTREPAYQGAVIGFLGLAGGVGTTTLALNFSALLPDLSDHDVTLIDASSSGAPWTAWFQDSNSAKTDETRRDAVLEDREHNYDAFDLRDRVKLITAPVFAEQATSRARFHEIIPSLIEDERRKGRNLVVDVGVQRDLSPILSLCDHLVVISDPSFNCFSRIASCVEALSSAYLYAVIHIGLNQIGAAGRIEFSAHEFANETGKRPLNFYRSDHRAVSLALSKGMPLLQRSLLKDQNAFATLATDCGIPIAPEKNSVSALFLNIRNRLGLR